MNGILLGDREDLPPALRDDFERTGTLHLLATGGLHVGILVLLLLGFLRHCAVPVQAARLVVLLVLPFYVIMAGERPSVARAAVVASVWLIGALLEREPDAPTTLSLAALILLVANPQSLFDPGFQYSFLTVITILNLMPLGTPWLERVGEFIPGKSRVRRLLRRGAAIAVGGFLLSVAAQIGVLPLMACYQNECAPVAVIANTFVVPILGLILALGFAAVTLGALLPALFLPVLKILDGLLAYVIGGIHAFSDVSHGVFAVRTPSVWWIAAYYALVWGWIGWRRLPQPPRQNSEPEASPPSRKISGLLWAFAAVNVLLIGVGTMRYRPPGVLKITFIDVGQGDACILETPSGRTILIDVGRISQDETDDEGRRAVVPLLRFKAINSLDALLLTHPDSDHVGGAATVLKRVPTALLIENGQTQDSPLMTRILNTAHAQNASLRVARRGQAIDLGDGVTAAVLSPTEEEAQGKTNNASIVLRVTYGRTAFLLTGDAEAEEEADILQSGQTLSCDALKVGHHGSNTSTSPAFLAAAHPGIAIVSVGAHNTYHHPSPDVVERLNALPAPLYRTDRDGAIICVSDGATVRVETTR